MGNGRVIVVGAGFAGLEVARRLAGAGVDPLVVEQEPQVGGRAASERLGGVLVDAGGCVVRAGDLALREMLAGAGLESMLELWPAGAVMQARDGALAPIDATSFSGIAAIPGMGRVAGWRAPRLERLTDRFARLLDATAPEQAARLDDRSVADFARLYFGTRALERWIEPRLAHASSLDAEQTSRVAFLLRGGPGPGAALGTLRGGAGALASRLAESVAVRRGIAVRAIEAAAGGRMRVRASERFAGDEDEFDAVVIATPAASALALAGAFLLPAERSFFEQARTLPSVSLVVALRERLEDAPRRVLVPAAERSPLAAIGVCSLDAPATPNGVGSIVTLLARAPYAAGAIDSSSQAIEKDLLGAATRWLPALDRSPVITQVARWRAGIPAFDVGRYRAIRHFFEIQRDLRRGGRRLYFAGDHLVTPSIDGALASGARAARAVLTDLARA